MRPLLLLLFLFSSCEAMASNSVIFMVNMNYAAKELDAVKNVAKRRGQEVVMIPPESLVPQGEQLFQTRSAVEKKIRALRPDWNDSKVKTAIADFMRKGSSSNRDASLTSQLGADVESLHSQAMALAAAEKSLGPIEDQIRKKAKELKGQGKRFDTVIFSAHSDGTNLSGETSNRLSSGGISRLAHELPSLFKEPRHVLLLGCYNMTETNHFRWRHDLFSNASLIGGFGKRAPSRYNPASMLYIERVLDKADELDKKLIASGGSLDPKYIEQMFKRLAVVTGTQSVIDYCLTIIEGQPGSGRLSCGEQWKIFNARAEAIHVEYLDLRNMTNDPPQEDDGTDLRDFYNALQDTCPARDAAQIPRNQVERAEKYRVSLRESLIRLIYWWIVQQNFKTYYTNEIVALERALITAGVREKLPPLDGTTGRVEFVKKYNAIENAFRARKNKIDDERYRIIGKPGAAIDRLKLDREERAVKEAEARFKIFYPLYALEGEDTVGDHDKSGSESTLARGGIPFHWIEGGAVLGPKGGQ